MRKLFPIIAVSTAVIILTSLIIGGINNKWFFLSRLGHLPCNLCFDLDTMRNYLQEGGKANVTIYFSELRQKTLIDCTSNFVEREADGSYKSLSHESKQELIKLLAQNTNVSEVKSEFGEALLFEAIYEGEIDTARFLMENGVNVNIKQKYGGSTPLHTAIFRGRLSLISLLIEHGADLGIKNGGGQTSFQYAIGNNNVEATKLLIELGAVVPKNAYIYVHNTYSDKQEIIELLLKHGADIDAVGNYGRTLIFNLKKKEDIEFILNNGAKSNIQDRYGKTPLFHARNKKIAKLLIDRGVDIDVRDRDDNTALSFALQSQKKDVAKYLIERGADVSWRHKKGATLLFYAPNREIAELLIEKGVDLHTKNTYGANALVSFVNLEKSMLLVEKGIDFNTKNRNSDTALSLALKGGKIDVAKYLIEKGADVNWKGDRGETLLFYTRTKEIAQLLVARGVDIYAQDDSGSTTLFHAVSNGYKSDLVEYLIKLGANIHWKGDRGETLLFYARTKEIAQLLVARGVDLNDLDNDSFSALYKAVNVPKHDYSWYSHHYPKSVSIRFNLLQYLIANGADVNWKDRTGKTLLFYATDIQTAKLLIENGVDINTRDNNGLTAIHKTINKLHTKEELDLIKYLIDNGAELNTIHTDKNGTNTTLLMAAFEKSNNFGEFLIANGADVNHRDDNGINILTRTIIKYRLDIAKLLIDNGAEIQYLNDKNLKDLTSSEYQKYKNSQFTQSLWTNKLLQLGERSQWMKYFKREKNKT